MSSLNVSFLSFPRATRCFPTLLPCDSTSQVWSECFRGVNGGKKSGSDLPLTTQAATSTTTVTQLPGHILTMVGVMLPTLPKTWVLCGVNTTGMVSIQLYGVNTTGVNTTGIQHWFYTSKPAKGRDQSQQTSQEVSHWFLSLALFFWRMIHLTDSCLLSCPLGQLTIGTRSPT